MVTTFTDYTTDDTPFTRHVTDESRHQYKVVVPTVPLGTLHTANLFIHLNHLFTDTKTRARPRPAHAVRLLASTDRQPTEHRTII